MMWTNLLREQLREPEVGAETVLMTLELTRKLELGPKAEDEIVSMTPMRTSPSQGQWLELEARDGIDLKKCHLKSLLPEPKVEDVEIVAKASGN